MNKEESIAQCTYESITHESVVVQPVDDNYKMFGLTKDVSNYIISQVRSFFIYDIKKTNWF